MLDVRKLFENDFDLIAAKNLLKEIKKEEKNILKRKSLETESMLRDLNKAEKEFLKNNNGMKKVFLSLYVRLEYIMDYFNQVNDDFYSKLKEEKERAWDFLIDEKEAETAGWNYKGNKPSVIKENEKKQILWCEKAYPNVNDDLWLIQLEEYLLIQFMKSQS